MNKKIDWLKVPRRSKVKCISTIGIAHDDELKLDDIFYYSSHHTKYNSYGEPIAYLVVRTLITDQVVGMYKADRFELVKDRKLKLKLP